MPAKGFAETGSQHGPFDLTLLPIGAYNKSWPDIHMNPEEAVAVHRDLNGEAGVMVPIHWATFRLAPHPNRPNACWSPRPRPECRWRSPGPVAGWSPPISPNTRRGGGCGDACDVPRASWSPLRSPRAAPTQQSDPALSSAPPQLIPAMPLPADAVGKAVARLDGLAADLMSSSGIPG